jgi:hypothetical protein
MHVVQIAYEEFSKIEVSNRLKVARKVSSGLRTQDSGLRTQDSGLTTQDSQLRTHNSGLPQKLNDTPPRIERAESTRYTVCPSRPTTGT